MTGSGLEDQAYALIVENGFDRIERYPALEAAWPTVEAALPFFFSDDCPTSRLVTVCRALVGFLEFTGRCDEELTLMQHAEQRTTAAGDFGNAGWFAYWAGRTHVARENVEETLACAGRAESDWIRAGFDQGFALVLRLRANAYHCNGNYPTAIGFYETALELERERLPNSREVAGLLEELASAEVNAGVPDAAEAHFNEALRIGQALQSTDIVTVVTGKLAALAGVREDWPCAETLAREALALAEQLGAPPDIAHMSALLAEVLFRRGLNEEGLAHARRALETYRKLGSPLLQGLQDTLREFGFDLPE